MVFFFHCLLQDFLDEFGSFGCGVDASRSQTGNVAGVHRRHGLLGVVGRVPGQTGLILVQNDGAARKNHHVANRNGASSTWIVVRLAPPGHQVAVNVVSQALQQGNPVAFRQQ